MFLFIYCIFFNIIKGMPENTKKVSRKPVFFTKKDSSLLKNFERKKRDLITEQKNAKEFKGILDIPLEIYNPYDEKISKCWANSKFTSSNYKIRSLDFNKISELSYYFYETLIKLPEFIDVCTKIGIDVKTDIPSNEMFRQFVIRFILSTDLKFEKTKANYFIQSIALLCYKHIVQWSQTRLTKHMFDKWFDVWFDLLDSINISTDKYCYWRVEKLFNEKYIAETQEQLDKLDFAETMESILLHKLNYSYPSLFCGNVTTTPINYPSVFDLIN